MADEHSQSEEPFTLEALTMDGDVAGLERALGSGERYPQADLDAALWRAAARGQSAALRALVAAGADVDAATTRDDSLGWPIFGAMENQQIETLRCLLDLGADVNAGSSRGWTPLHVAVDSEADSAVQTGAPAMSVAVTALLLEHGADPAARDDRGQTPLDIALHYPHERAAALLRAALARRGEHERIARWPTGIPAIRPAAVSSDPAVPSFTADDAVEYVRATNEGGGWFVPVAPYTIELVEFVTAGSWRLPWPGHGIAQPPDTLLCVVALAGRFRRRMPPRHRPPLRSWYRRKCVVFDAHTGNVLQRPVDPRMGFEPHPR